MRGQSITRLIFDQVAAAYQIPVEHINRGSLKRPYPEARKEVAYRLRTERGWTLAQIGEALNVNHSSVLAMLQTRKEPESTIPSKMIRAYVRESMDGFQSRQQVRETARRRADERPSVCASPSRRPEAHRKGDLRAD